MFSVHILLKHADQAHGLTNVVIISGSC